MKAWEQEGEAGGSGSLPPAARRFSHHAMATVFEIAIVHEDAGYAEQCAHEAFREVDRLERVLSRYIENSDISRVNVARVGEPVRVGVDAFDCLEHCAALSSATNRACDVTIGALLEHWSKVEATGLPGTGDRPAEVARETGMSQVHLDKEEHTVTRGSDRLIIDLGGYGKGYAVDRMARVLDDWDIESALLHAGTSSVLALGAPPGERGWQVTLRHPSDREQVIGRFYLDRRAVSGSGLRKGCHIIDPRSGNPASETRAAWAITLTAAVGDALSTAFMIMSPEEIREYRERDPRTRAIVIRGDAGTTETVLRFGDCRDLERP